MNPEGRFSVIYFHRKRYPNATFSIELIFDDVRNRLREKIDPIAYVVRYNSRGLLRRIAIVLECWLQRREVNHVTGDINFAGILLPKNRTIQTIHDCANIDRNVGLRRLVLRFFWLQLPVNRCCLVTTVSQYSKSRILSHVRCDPKKIHIIPNAVSTRFFPSPASHFSEKPRILQVGTAINKNIERLAESLSGIDCHLTIVGKLSNSQISALTLSKIDFENRMNLTDEEIVQEYIRTDILAFVSTDEGFGMPIIEANMVGRAVVTSDAASMPEVAGSAACLVDPLSIDSIREGFLKVITDSQYREDLIARGFANAQRYHPEQIANQYLDLYRVILAS